MGCSFSIRAGGDYTFDKFRKLKSSLQRRRMLLPAYLLDKDFFADIKTYMDPSGLQDIRYQF